MTDDPDDYDVFLDTWEPGPRAVHASLPQNLTDPVARMRMLEDMSGDEPLERTLWVQGPKTMDEDEHALRVFKFFEENHDRWAGHFEDYLEARDVPMEKVETFVRAFATDWIDGASRRQNSAAMMAIKASIRDLDALRHPHGLDRWVINGVDPAAKALFNPEEMATIFDANNGLIASFLPDYADELDYLGLSSLSDLWVRRGVYMPELHPERRELHYLSSYSLALGPVEQFAQTFTPKTKGKGTPCVFSAPLPSIQTRVVAFAPFIRGMDLSQLEFVVAPPTEATPLFNDGEHGGIHEFRFL